MPLFRVIPSFRAPRTIEGFDYSGPAETRIGDVVKIPFRKQTIVGVVAEKLTKTNVPKSAIKEIIGPYADLRLNTKTLALMQALAVRSFSSPASVLHAWIGATPKRPSEGGILKTTPGRSAVTDAFRLLNNHWHHPEGVIATARRAIDAGQRVLILTPWTEHAGALADACGGTALTSGLNDGDRFRAWCGFIRGEVRCLVATRIGAWLATEADLVIVDEPENDDHKQDELAPRYDARWVAAEAKKQGVPVVAIGLTSRIASPIPNPQIPQVNITWVDTHRADWSGVAGLQGRSLIAIEDTVAAHHPVTIIHPIHGMRARFRCADCGWSAACVRCGNGLTPQRNELHCTRCNAHEPMPGSCPHCSGTDFSRSRPGRDALVRDLSQRGITATVASLGEWNAVSARLPPQSLVVLTDLSLLPGAGEDLRRRERLIIAFRRLADLCVAQDAHLVVQGDAAMLDDARTWLTTDGCAAALRREWDERAAFGLPPAMRLVKLLVRGGTKSAEDLVTNLRPRVPAGARLDGPFAVERLPGTRTPRSVIHLTLPLNTPDTAIQRLISPVLTANTLVDLDPIALYE